MRRKEISAGAEKLTDFFSMAGPQYYYVDKTRLIKDMIDAGFLDAFPMLILRPRRFGKTLALSMLKTFFDINEVDKAWIFSNLAISQDKELCERHQNKYPVISVSFKDIEGSSYDQMLYMMNLRLKRDAQKHQAAILSEMAFDGKPRDILYDEADRDKLLRIMATNGSEMDLMEYFEILTRMLYGYYRVKPLVMIDEYDAPLNNAFGQEYLNRTASLIRGMFSAGFKTNEYLGGVVITGVLQIAKTNILSGLNNLMVDSVISGSDYADDFGFTQDEVDEMLAYYSIEDKRGMIKDWYDGYRIRGVYVYNPFSVAQAVRSLSKLGSEAVCENYWLDTGGTGLLREMLDSAKNDSELKDLFDQLLDGRSVETGYAISVVYSDILESRETIIGTLLLSGYLTMDDKRNLRIPNHEVMSGFAALCKSYNREADSKMLPELVRAYAEGDPEEAKRILDEYFEETLRARDLNSSENNYHYFICGAMAALRNRMGDWRFESNEQKALGFADLVLRNRKTRKAIIIEEKAIKRGHPGKDESERDWRGRQIAKARDMAFRQVHETEYDSIEGYEVSVYVNVYYRHKAWVFKENQGS